MVTAPTAKEYINNGSPSPTRISNVFEPKTFEVASSISPFRAFATEIIVSGTDVAAAMTVKAIIIGETFRIVARLIEDCVRKKVAIPIKIIVEIKIVISFEMEISFNLGFCFLTFL